MYDSIPLWFAIPLFVLLIAALAWMKWKDYRRLREEAAREYISTEFVEVHNPVLSKSDTPVFDIMAADRLTWPEIQRIEEKI